MHDRLSAIIEQHGLKHWSFAVRRDAEFMAWIAEQTLDLPSDTLFATRVYCAATGERPGCPNNRTRRLKGIQHGWGYCGLTGQCQCAREAVSASLKAAKAQESLDHKADTQAKREATNLARYGHRNTGQTVQAKSAHAQFYADRDNVVAQLRKQAATMQRLYNVNNAAHLRAIAEKKQATLQARYGIRNPMQSQTIAAKSLATRAEQGYAESYYRRNYERLSQRLHDDFAMRLLTLFEDYAGTAARQVLQLACDGCSRQIDWRIDYRNRPRCWVCQPREYISQEERGLLAYLRDDLGIAGLISGDRTLIAPFEIDILSEQHKIGIEYCGLYWHSQRQRPWPSYHLNKLNEMTKRGYRLFTVYSDEWLLRPEIVRSKFRHVFQKIEHRLFARKLTIVELDSARGDAFYERSHILGSVRAACHLGLSDGTRIVAAMSFSKVIESKLKDLPQPAYELVRFAVLPDVTVVGGASRLFKEFVRSRSPNAVLSYADRRWSDGGLYRTLGFVQDGIGRPSYSYVEDYAKRHFRFNYRKDVLERALGEPVEYEWDTMKLLDFDRIWDCGTLRFVWTNGS